MRTTFLITVITVLSVTGKDPSRHEPLRGHQIWQLSGDAGTVPEDLMRQGLLDVLEHSGPARKVRVPFELLEGTRKIFQEKGISHEVLVQDLAEYLEKSERRTKRSASNEVCDSDYCPQPFNDNYMTFEQMEYYLKNLCENDTRLTLTSLGKSIEGRDIWMVHVKAEKADSKAMWIEAGIHAREWISSAVGLHVLHWLAEDKTLTSNVDVYVVPMANPDGYEFSRTTTRLWRKNRRENPDSHCMGVDLNRNWDFHYGEGASKEPCSEVFQGEGPFSEPETKALQGKMTELKDDLHLVFSLHSYGQSLLYPWGYTKEKAPDTDDLIREGQAFADAVKDTHGKTYDVINSAGDLYTASGATDDWAKGELGIKYTYTLELRDKGPLGFVLDSSHILPCSEEVWNGLKVLMKNIFK